MKPISCNRVSIKNRLNWIDMKREGERKKETSKSRIKNSLFVHHIVLERDVTLSFFFFLQEIKAVQAFYRFLRFCFVSFSLSYLECVNLNFQSIWQDMFFA
jgi:hypothetical protein